jgi:hypothetical protein
MNTLHKQIALKLDKTNKRIQIFEIDHNLSLSVNFILKVTETLKTFFLNLMLKKGEISFLLTINYFSFC